MIKTPKQLVVVVLLSFIVPVALILLLVQLITGGMNADPDSGAMSEDAIAERLRPVGQVNVGTVPGASSAPAEMVATSAPAAEAASPAEQVYKTSCQMCHAAGLAGAPKMGDKAAWEARIALGIDTLYNSAINGKNAMPPKGGSTASDSDIKAAVDLMVSQSK